MTCAEAGGQHFEIPQRRENSYVALSTDGYRNVGSAHQCSRLAVTSKKKQVVKTDVGFNIDGRIPHYVNSATAT